MNSSTIYCAISMVRITDGYPQKGDGCENKPGSIGTNDNLSKVETGLEVMPTQLHQSCGE